MQAACWHPVVCLVSLFEYPDKNQPFACHDFIEESSTTLHIIKQWGEDPFKSLYALVCLFPCKINSCTSAMSCVKGALQ